MLQTERRETLFNRCTSILAGAALAFAVCTLLLLGAAWLISTGRAAEGQMQLFCCLGAGLGCFAGGCYAAFREGRQALVVALAVSGVFFAAWLTVGSALYAMTTLEQALPLLGASAAGAVPAGFVGASGGGGGRRRGRS